MLMSCTVLLDPDGSGFRKVWRGDLALGGRRKQILVRAAESAFSCLLFCSYSCTHLPSHAPTFTYHVDHVEASSQPLVRDCFEKGNDSRLLPQLYFINLAVVATAFTQASRRASTLV